MGPSPHTYKTTKSDPLVCDGRTQAHPTTPRATTLRNKTSPNTQHTGFRVSGAPTGYSKELSKVTPRNMLWTEAPKLLPVPRNSWAERFRGTFRARAPSNSVKCWPKSAQVVRILSKLIGRCVQLNLKFIPRDSTNSGASSHRPCRALPSPSLPPFPKCILGELLNVET